MGADGRSAFFDCAHDVVHRYVGEVHPDFAVYRAFHHRRRCKRFGRRFAVGGYQSRHPQFRAPEIAHHYYQAVRHFGRQQLSQYRFSRRARGFAVIVGPVAFAPRSQPPRIAVVGRIEMAFAQGVQVFADFFFGPYRVCVGQEFAAPFARRRFGRRFEGQIGVFGHFLPHFSEKPPPADVRRERFVRFQRQPYERGLAHDVVFGYEAPEA